MNLEIETLEQLISRARSCRKCCDAPGRAPIPQEPNPLFQVSDTARICIASQAPGVRAHNARLPFADRSGERLRAWMEVTPDELLGRVTSAFWTIHFLPGPVGAALLTAAVAGFGVPAVTLVVGALLVVVASVGALTPVRVREPALVTSCSAVWPAW